MCAYRWVRPWFLTCLTCSWFSLVCHASWKLHTKMRFSRGRVRCSMCVCLCVFVCVCVRARCVWLQVWVRQSSPPPPHSPSRLKRISCCRAYLPAQAHASAHSARTDKQIASCVRVRLHFAHRVSRKEPQTQTSNTSLRAACLACVYVCVCVCARARGVRAGGSPDAKLERGGGECGGQGAGGAGVCVCACLRACVAKAG